MKLARGRMYKVQDTASLETKVHGSKDATPRLLLNTRSLQ